MSDNRVIVIDYYILRKVIENILKKCTRENWEESCLVLQRYFSWEYEDYHYEK
ncbi:TPA: Imm8 family immunity protein [Salmonella enterica subsp. enterica serovar Waycross]